MFRIIILIIALVAGGSAAWLALAVRSDTPVVVAAPAPPAPAVDVQDVLVAAADLEPGQTLKPEHLRWQSWPAASVNSSLITREARPDATEAIAGSMVRSRIRAQEPVRDDMFGPLNANSLSAQLAPGKRAVAVRITAENTAGGFVLPNDRVDVLHTVAEQVAGAADKHFVTRTILRNVTVLAIDQALDQGGDEQKKPKSATVGKTATLELSPLQTETVTAAEAGGTLSLTLRPASENAEISLQPSPRPTMRVVRGDRVEIVRIDNSPAAADKATVQAPRSRPGS